jgi:hypothetical protein
LVLLCFYLWISLPKSLLLLLEKRFPEVDESKEDKESNIKTVESLTWFKWLFFVLGALPPVVKLMAITGVL